MARLKAVWALESRGFRKMIPPLLPFHQGKRSALNAGRGLLNTVFCMIAAEALEAVGALSGLMCYKLFPIVLKLYYNLVV